MEQGKVIVKVYFRTLYIKNI